jgi:hypothetical protein
MKKPFDAKYIYLLPDMLETQLKAFHDMQKPLKIDSNKISMQIAKTENGISILIGLINEEKRKHGKSN